MYFVSQLQLSKMAEALTLTRPDETRESRSLHGMSRTLINNMIEGVTNGLSQRRSTLLALDTKFRQRARILSLHLATATQSHLSDV
jgi:large subunit ribosomal protein L6